MFLGCRDDPPSGPTHRQYPSGPVATVDPTPNPEQGCWVWPDTAVIDPLDEGGIYPYSAPRCGVNLALAWPGFVSQDGFTYTHIRGGASQTPWLHFPGSLGLTPPAGWPWTITFDRAVRNVRVYTRWAEFTGGKVVVQGWGGVVLAERAIPQSPTYYPGTSTPTGIVDTLSFPDTDVYTVRIIPAVDPNNPSDPGEFMAWQAQSDPPPPPPPDTLCNFVDTLGFPQDVEPLNDTTVRRAMENLLARSKIDRPFSERRELVAVVRRNPDGTFRVDDIPTQEVMYPQACTPGTQGCVVEFCAVAWNPVPLYTDPTVVAIMHTHPAAENDVPGCPGNPSYKYEPLLQQGGSSWDYRIKTTINYERGRRLIPPVPHYIIDIGRVYYIPRMASQYSGLFQYMFRGLNPRSCRWVL